MRARVCVCIYSEVTMLNKKYRAMIPNARNEKKKHMQFFFMEGGKLRQVMHQKRDAELGLVSHGIEEGGWAIRYKTKRRDSGWRGTDRWCSNRV